MYLHDVGQRMTLPCACTTVRKSGRSLLRFYEEAMIGTGVTITQFAILRALNRNGATPLTDLAAELVMERTSLYRTLAPLEQAGHVTIENAPKGRTKIAELTTSGRTIMDEAAPNWEAAQSVVVSAIGEDRWADLSQLLLDIPKILETRP